MTTIASQDSEDSHVSTGATPAPADEVLTRVPNGASDAGPDPPPHPEAPLFVGLSVEPFVYYKEPPTGPHAGEILQPLAALPTRATDPRP